MIVSGIVVCSSILICVCIFILSKTLLISSATVIVSAGGAIWLNAFAMVLFTMKHINIFSKTIHNTYHDIYM